MCVVVFAALLPVLGASRAHADSHSVAVTSPAPATLTAELYTPRGTGPFPAVILLHGCGGIGPNVKEWAVFYPSCTGWKALPGSTPVLMLLGGKDDWTPSAPCEALAKSAAEAGRSVLAVVYPDAHHHFDGAEVRRQTVVSDARGGLGATIDYNPRAHEDAEMQVRAFLAAHLGK